MTALTHQEGTKDLDFRGADGVEVTLLWAGEEFELEIRPDDDPLAVFHDPYAYAAARGPELLAAA